MALAALEPPMSPFPFPDEDEDGAQSARLENAPDVAEYMTDARTLRARTKPTKYKQDESPTEERFAGFSRARRQELNEQFKINQATRKIIRNNTAMIRSQALNHSCPLLMKRAIERGDFDQNSTSSLLRVQIKRVAVAEDGYYYDRSALTNYIRENFSKRIVSPVTSEPMGPVVYYTEKAEGNKWKSKKWEPILGLMA